jgi:hypothetical protein
MGKITKTRKMVGNGARQITTPAIFRVNEEPWNK